MDEIDRKKNENHMKFVFFQDFHLLAKHEMEQQSEKTTDLLYSVEYTAASTFKNLSQADITTMCWNLFVHAREQNRPLIPHTISDSLIDVIGIFEALIL